MSVPKNDPPLFELDQLCRILRDPTRWQLIRALSTGEYLPVNEIARRIGRDASLTSKHIAILRKHGMIVVVYGRFYRLAPVFLPKPGERTLDLGHCILKLDAPA